MITKEIVHLNADNRVLIEVLDGRSIRLTFDAFPLEIIRDKKKISQINVSGIPFISLQEYNKVFVTVNEMLHTYIISEIDQINDTCFQAHTMPRTKSSFFITPMIGDSRGVFKWQQYFVNTFITTNNKIIILYRFFNTDDYKQFEHSMLKYPLFSRLLDKDKQLVMVEYNVPEEYSDIIDLFKNGQYSKMPEKYKEKILRFHNITKDTLIGKILFKADERRKQLELDLDVTIPEDVELYDKPDNKEIIEI